ncbi:hypothetical protein [Curtobacterium sp. GC_Cur_2]|uniref:hypothetical protein n=1 Tax=Curtobacterium sp. GC_Cur_2 TaxID=2937373 RepID=UPI00226B9DE0|nr:hypothetical protein [Curtobacterium sp. GC_Cur_2]
MLAVLSVPGSLVMAGWKVVLFCAAPSLFLAATVIFTFGVAAAKIWAVRRYRLSFAFDATNGDRMRFRQAGHRWIGGAVTAMSIVFIGCSVPMLVGRAHPVHYDKWVAIIIASATFAELGIGVCGAVTARKDGEPLVEATKLVNVAAAVVLLVLTQSALLSFAGSVEEAAAFTGASGVFFGGVAAVMGLAMALRRFPDTPAPTSVDQAGLERERHELGPVAGVDLRHGPVHVGLDREW